MVDSWLLAYYVPTFSSGPIEEDLRRQVTGANL